MHAKFMYVKVISTHYSGSGCAAAVHVDMRPAGICISIKMLVLLCYESIHIVVCQCLHCYMVHACIKGGKDACMMCIILILLYTCTVTSELSDTGLSGNSFIQHSICCEASSLSCIQFDHHLIHPTPDSSNT